MYISSRIPMTSAMKEIILAVSRTVSPWAIWLLPCLLYTSIGWFYRDVARRPVLRPGAFSRSPAHSGRPGDIPGDKFAYTCH